MQRTVAIVGAGRMGSVVAARIPSSTRTIVIDRNADRAGRLAERIGGTAADRLAAAAAAQMVFVVLPAPAAEASIRSLAGIVGSGCMLINMATAARIDGALIGQCPGVAVIDARIIGHAGAMSGGAPGIVVVSGADDRQLAAIRRQLPGFRSVERGDAGLVKTINTVATTEGLRAAVTIRKELAALDIPAPWIDVAIQTVAAGVMRAYVAGDLGDFARQLARRLSTADDPGESSSG